MRIKRIEIDGFKSYAQRQVIDGFDPQFNAITGLNGSGKSNILDAVCFVLGISNLSQVRATQLSDLVYKHGQGGIGKATVTITFDNTDMSNRPIGYDKYDEIIVRRQVVICGRNNYTINGTAVTNSRVADMFRSVGLNVNNPHFLIMQGRITKVLNMKPMEILGMIEEAAGTRMYDSKKQSALRTIDKKEGKMDEIKQLMQFDIIPRVEKLKKDRSNYLEFQKIGRELEAMQRKLIAYDFLSSQVQVQDWENGIAKIKSDIKGIDKEIRDSGEELARKEVQLKELEANRINKSGKERKELEECIKKTTVALTQVEARRDGLRDKEMETRIAAERKTKSIASDKKELEKKRRELKKLEEESGGEEKRGQEVEEAVRKARYRLAALAKGMTTDEQGQAVTLDAQLTAQRSALSDLETKMKTAQMRLKQLEPSLAKKSRELGTIAHQADTEEHERIKLQSELENAEVQLRNLNFDERQELNLREKQRNLEADREHLTDEVMNFEARNQQLKFNYSSPYPNFDHRKVFGVVAKLFRVRDSRFSTALEIAAGGSLYNVVVEDARAGADLLKHGNLLRRVTMIPLDKIKGEVLEEGKLRRARSLVGDENVYLAKDLIEYNPRLEKAMQHVFGKVLICINDDAAKMVTFDNKILVRTVTLAGSDYKPAGVLTGGSRPSKTALLSEIGVMFEKTTRLTDIEQQIREIDEQLRHLAPLQMEFTKLTEIQTRLKCRLQVLNENLKHSAAQMLRDEIAEMEAEIPKHREVVENCIKEKRTLEKRVEELAERKKNEKLYQEREKKEAQKQLAAAEKDLAVMKSTFEKAKLALNTLREEITSLESGVAEDEEELEKLMQKAENSDGKMKELESEIAAAKAKADKAHQEMEAFTERMREHDAHIRSVVEKVNELKKSIKESDLAKEQLQQDLQSLKKNIESRTKRTVELEKKHAWISEEKHHFGRSGTAYDFEGYSLERGRKEIEERAARKQQLERSINAKAMNMLGTAEEQCRQLEIKLEKLKSDKATLMETISRLDKKKEDEIIKAHEKVNQDFGNIFSTLLPGTFAKLEPPRNAASALGGLEVKVAFGNQWKESLGELSGGQRSLVALSLVLAMLKFKPAPIYILDEVDAALDISHTQNIGAMIKTHFKESQFIIVSLKDGMFNHANVLFKTRFADGTSTVTRTENKNQWVIDEPMEIRRTRENNENDSNVPKRTRKN